MYLVNDTGLLICGSDRHPLISGVRIDEEVTSWQLTDLDGNSIERDQAPLARAILLGEPYSREFIVRGTIDDACVGQDNAAPIKDDSGQVTVGIVVFIDITNRWSQDRAEQGAEEKPPKTDRSACKCPALRRCPFVKLRADTTPAGRRDRLGRSGPAA